MCMQTGFSVISLFACGRSTLPTLVLTCLQESWVILQRSRQLIGLGEALALGAHGSITAKRVEAGRGIASCHGRTCVTLHQKQFGSARGHALTTQEVCVWVSGWQKPRSQAAGHPASGTRLTVRSLDALGRCLPSSFPCPPRALSQDCHFTKARSSHLLHWGHLTGERHLRPLGRARRCQDAPAPEWAGAEVPRTPFWGVPFFPLGWFLWSAARVYHPPRPAPLRGCQRLETTVWDSPGPGPPRRILPVPGQHPASPHPSSAPKSCSRTRRPFLAELNTNHSAQEISTWRP